MSSRYKHHKTMGWRIIQQPLTTIEKGLGMVCHESCNQYIATYYIYVLIILAHIMFISFAY